MQNSRCSGKGISPGKNSISPSLRGFECRIAPIAGVRTGFVVLRFFQMGILGYPGLQLSGFLFLYFGEATIFAGVGHWLHDTPPIFQTG
jgi:hypothetical protein